MSAEKIISQEVNDLPPLTTPEKSVKLSSPVDINNLWARARKEQEKENKVNLVFFINTLSNFYCWNYFIFLITYFHI